MSPTQRSRPELSAHGALAAGARRRLLAVLEDRGPLDAHALAGELGLHVSTVRSHLEVLRQAGLVTARPLPRPTAGRPRTVYAAVSRAGTGYPALTAVLAAHLGATPQARQVRAERAGVAWAAQLVPDPAPAAVAAEEAARQVSGLFAAMGFDPELSEPTDGTRQIRLRACPFRAPARAHPEVVCSVHLGVLRGALARYGAPPATATLAPFVEPELCVARLAPPG